MSLINIETFKMIANQFCGQILSRSSETLLVLEDQPTPFLVPLLLILLNEFHLTQYE